MRLILVRHGQTPSNVAGALDTTVPGPGLTELGHLQAEALPGALAHENIGALFASTQTRAQLTAAPLARTLGLEVIVRDGLREITAGDLEMRTDWESIVTYHQTAFAWAEGDLERRMPGGETGAEVFARFDSVVVEAHQSGHAVVAAVAHGQIIRTWAAARCDNVAIDFAIEHALRNTGVIVLDGSPDAGWTMFSWSDVALGGERLTEGPEETGPGGERDGQFG